MNDATQAPLQPFLAEVARKRLGELVAVHTGNRTYVGTLVAIDATRLVLDADSDALDEAVYTHVDVSRVEAIDTLRR